jgi:hypothetical protein
MPNSAKLKAPKKNYPSRYDGTCTGPASPYEKILGESYRLVAKLESDAKIETKQWMLESWRAEEIKLMEMMRNVNLPAGQKLIISCLINAIQVGDYKMMDTFLNRIVGKVKEEIVLTPGQQEQSPDNARQLLLEAIIEPTFTRVE